MPETLYALRLCAAHDFTPDEVLKNQFVLTGVKTPPPLGMLPMRLDKLVLNHGMGLNPIPLEDERNRLFGAFIGVGVDAEGGLIAADSFRRFNSKGRSFEKDFEAYVSGIAGRYVVVLDSGARQRVYHDPMGQMAVFYNAGAGLAASCMALALDRDPIPNPALTGAAAPGDNGGGVFPLGHSLDRDVRVLLPNHRLELSDFTARRSWPRASDLPRPSKARMGKLIERMIARQRQILDALEPMGCDLALSGGAGSRALLATMPPGMRDGLGAVFGFDCHETQTDDALAAEHLCASHDIPYNRLTVADAKAGFGHSKYLKRQRMRRYWLRTSRMCPVPAEQRCNAVALLDRGQVELRGEGMGLLQSTWRRGQGPGQSKPKSGLKYEIAQMLGLDAPEAAETAAWEGEYKVWKASLPKPAQALVHDFIALELGAAARFAHYGGQAERFRLSPFGDRDLIGLTLQMPVTERFGGGAISRLIETADADLADEPYASDMEELLSAGLVEASGGAVRSGS